MVSRRDVVDAYQVLLRRLPENEEAISHHRAIHRNIDSLMRSLQDSAEYKSLCKEPTKSSIKRITPSELDWFISESDRLGPPASPPVEKFWKDCVYLPAVAIDEDADPFSEVYVRQQIALYKEISNREIDQQVNELTTFDMETHVDAENPYANTPPWVALHTARVSFAIHRSMLAAGDHILDMGCGWGASSELMAFLGLKVTGLDINPAFVGLVNSRAARKKINVDAVLGSFEKIPGETSYDGVLFYESLHHSIRPWQTLSLVQSRLKPTGKLLLAGEPINAMWKHWGIRTDPLSLYCIRKFGWFESGWSLDFITTCIRRCGFEVSYLRAEPEPIGWIIVASKP